MMHPILNTNVARGLPVSVNNRKRDRNSLRCLLGFHNWKIIDGPSMDLVPPDRPLDYTSPKRQCGRCGRVEGFIGSGVCGGKKLRWVRGPLGCTHCGTDDCPLCDPAKLAKSFSVMTRKELLGYFGCHGTCTLVSKQMDQGHHVRIVLVDGQVASFNQSCELACFRAAATWLKYNAKPIA